MAVRARGQLRGAGRVHLDLADRLGRLLGLQLECVGPRVERFDLCGEALGIGRHVRVAEVAALADDVHGVGCGGEARDGALDLLGPLEVVRRDGLECHGRQDDVRDKVLGAHSHVRTPSLEAHGKALAQSLDCI